jgi:hypothetical protein
VHYQKTGNAPWPGTNHVKDTLTPKGYFFTLARFYQQKTGAKKK